MRYIPRLFLLIFLSLICIFAITDSRSVYIIPYWGESVFITDLDLDGSNDIITGHIGDCGGSNKTISILHNDGFGTFELTDSSKSFCGYQWNIFAVDVNNDAYPDIVALHGDNSTGTPQVFIRVYYNSGGTFPNSNYIDFNLNASNTINYFSHGDVNGDGFVDIVFISSYGNFWGVIYNDSTGHFTDPEYHSIQSIYPLWIECADLNNDGRDDVVVGGQLTEVFLSYPTGYQPIYFSQGSEEVKIVDFDGDGYKDIITSSVVPVYWITKVVIFKNNGDNTFTQMPYYYFNYPANYFFLADFNNDGLPDVLFQLEDNLGDYIYYNGGNFQFADSLFVSIPCSSGIHGWCADMDNNGFIDIATIYGNNLNIMFNDGNGHFVPDPIVGINTKLSHPTSVFTVYPNPFQYETFFNLNLPNPAFVELSVFDLQGNLIASPISRQMEKGLHQIKWQGIDQNHHFEKSVYVAGLKINRKYIKVIKLIEF
jgi:hypothetical protein